MLEINQSGLVYFELAGYLGMVADKFLRSSSCQETKPNCCKGFLSYNFCLNCFIIYHG